MRCIFFDDDLSFKIQAGAVAPVFMHIAGIAVNAAMLTTGVRVHAVCHTHIFTLYFIYNRFALLLHGPTISSYVTLPVATSATNDLIKPAVKLVDKLYEKGRLYKKAGIMLSGLVPDETIQGNLFVAEKHNGKRLLMDMIDNINFSQRDDVLKFAASGTTRDWKMRMELRSPRYTSRWDELFQVK